MCPSPHAHQRQALCLPPSLGGAPPPVPEQPGSRKPSPARGGSWALQAHLRPAFLLNTALLFYGEPLLDVCLDDLQRAAPGLWPHPGPLGACAPLTCVSHSQYPVGILSPSPPVAGLGSAGVRGPRRPPCPPWLVGSIIFSFILFWSEKGIGGDAVYYFFFLRIGDFFVT